MDLPLEIYQLIFEHVDVSDSNLHSVIMRSCKLFYSIYRSTDHLRVAAQKKLYAVSTRGIYQWTNNDWLLVGNTGVRCNDLRVAFAGDGCVWLLSSRGLYCFDFFTKSTTFCYGPPPFYDPASSSLGHAGHWLLSAGGKEESNTVFGFNLKAYRAQLDPGWTVFCTLPCAVQRATIVLCEQKLFVVSFVGGIVRQSMTLAPEGDGVVLPVQCEVLQDVDTVQGAGFFHDRSGQFVYFAGGLRNRTQGVVTVFRYDVLNHLCIQLMSLRKPRNQPILCEVSGRLLVLGGRRTSGTDLREMCHEVEICELGKSWHRSKLPPIDSIRACFVV